MRRNIRVGFSLAFLLLAAGALGACQAGGATGASTTGSVSAPSASSDVSLVPGDPIVAMKNKKKDASFAGLKLYKVYNTTENLCTKTCRGDARCVKESFTPVRKMGKYIAGQCQLYGR